MIQEQSIAGATGTRRERLRAMMREDILKAARTIIIETGIKDLSMRALARDVGVTAPTLYDYFPSKDAVLDALYLEAVSELLGEFEQAEMRDEPAVERLLHVARLYRAFAQQRSDLFLLVFGRVDASRQPDPDIHAQAKRLMEPVERLVAEAIQLGEFPLDLAPTFGQYLWATVHGFAMLELHGVMGDCSAEDHDRMFEANLRLLRRSFRGGSDEGSPCLT